MIAMGDDGERWTTVVFNRPSALCRQSRRKDGGGTPNGYGGDGPPLGTVAVVLPPSVDAPLHWPSRVLNHSFRNSLLPPLALAFGCTKCRHTAASSAPFIP